MSLGKLVDKLLNKELDIETRKNFYMNLDDEVMALFLLDKHEKKRVYTEVAVSDKLLEVI